MSRIKRRKINNSLEEKIITGLIISDKFCRDLEFQLKFEYFRNKFAAIISKWCIQYFKKYKESPKKRITDIYETEVENLKSSEVELIFAFLEKLSEEYETEEEDFNKDFLLDKSINYFKERSIENLADRMNKYLSAGKPIKAEDELLNYHKVDKVNCEWIDPFSKKEINKTFEDSEENKLFSLPGALGEMAGEFEREWLIAVLGPYKRGKTNWLYEILMAALEAKLKVAFVSLEMGDVKTKSRLYKRITGLTDPGKEGNIIYPVFDCKSNQDGSCGKSCRTNDENLIDDPDDDLPLYSSSLKYNPCTYCRDNKKKYKFYKPAVWYTDFSRGSINRKNVYDQVNRFKLMYKNNLRIRSYPAYTANLSDIERDLDILAISENFIPDVIIVDYFDILRPEDSRKSGREVIDETWKSGKRMSMQRHCLVVTATQIGDKKVLNKKNVKASDIGEEGRKLGHLDLMLMLNQTPEEKRKGIMRISTGMSRHDSFDEIAFTYVLQNLNIGQSVLDSYMIKRRIYS